MMLTVAAVALLAQVALAVAGPSTVGDSAPNGVIEVQTPGADARPAPRLGELDPAVEKDMPICAATATDDVTGMLGNGDANTRAEAIAAALKECRDGGGKQCEITSVACDPSRSSE